MLEELDDRKVVCQGTKHSLLFQMSRDPGGEERFGKEAEGVFLAEAG